MPAYDRVIYAQGAQAGRDAAQRFLHLALALKEHTALPERPVQIAVEDAVCNLV